MSIKENRSKAYKLYYATFKRIGVAAPKMHEELVSLSVQEYDIVLSFGANLIQLSYFDPAGEEVIEIFEIWEVATIRFIEVTMKRYVSEVTISVLEDGEI